MPTSTRTVVFTDLANYTQRVSRSDRSELRDLLSEHERVVKGIITEHGGVVVKNLGDSYMALFSSATDAIRAGLAAVEQGLQGDGIPLRVSCATGDVEEIDGDAFGDAVNLSARINSKTPAGQIWFSEGTQLCMNPSEIPWDGVGQFALKGIPGEVSIYRAVPTSRCYLPQVVTKALKRGNLCLVRAGEGPPTLPPDPVIIFLDFEAGSPQLTEMVDSLPVLDPGKLWLASYTLAPSDRHAWTSYGRGLLVGKTETIDSTLEQTRREITKPVGTHTIILDTAEPADMDLVMAGLALPTVPMASVVEGYTYDLLPDGRWVNRSPQAVLRIDASHNGVQVTALASGIELAGKMLSPASTTMLENGVTLRTPSGPIQYRKMESAAYLGVLLADTPLKIGVNQGEKTELGREPNHPGIALPDRRGQENIRWCTGSRAARARESGFTLDRALAGRRQASIESTGSGQCTVSSLHDRCPTWVMQDNGQLSRVEAASAATAGDFIVTGTSVMALRLPEILE